MDPRILHKLFQTESFKIAAVSLAVAGFVILLSAIAYAIENIGYSTDLLLVLIIASLWKKEIFNLVHK